MDTVNIKVGIEMPESLYRQLRDHARITKTSVSKLCREAARNELERALREAGRAPDLAE